MNLLKLFNLYSILFISATCIFYTSKYFYVFIIFILLIYTLFLKTNKDYIINKNIYYSVLIFIYLSLISSIWGIVKYKNYMYIVEAFMQSIIILMIIRYAKAKGTNGYKNFYNSILVIGNLLAIIGLYECYFKQNIFVNLIKDQHYVAQIRYTFGLAEYRAFNLFYHPIVYCNFLLCLFWINKFIIKKNKKLNKLYYIIQTIVLINIYFTKSRSGWISLVITLILYFFINKDLSIYKILNNKNRLLKILFSIVVLIILLIIFNREILYFLNKILERFGELNSTVGSVSKLQRTGNIKLLLYNSLMNNPINFLIGNGYGSASEILKNNQIIILGFTAADNQYLSMIYENGLIPLLIYMYILIKIYHETKIKKDIYNLTSFFIIISISCCMFFYDGLKWEDMFLLNFVAISKFVFKDFNDKEKKK